MNDPVATALVDSTAPAGGVGEINLLDLLLVILAARRIILGLALAAGAAAAAVAFGLLPNVYRSEATLTVLPGTKQTDLAAAGGLGGMATDLFGGGGSKELARLEVTAKSRELARRVIAEHDLMPVLFPKLWDPQVKTWRGQKIPTEQDGIRRLMAMRSVTTEVKKGVLVLAVEHRDPVMAKAMVEWYLGGLSEILREAVLREAIDNQRFFQEQLQHTADALLRDKLAGLLAKEIERETFARAQHYYSFEVVDPPLQIDEDKKVRPNRPLICVMAVVVALAFGVIAAFLREFGRSMKANADPAQLARLRQALPWGTRWLAS
ncbi:MAG: Wzz/FepE/Etk N-terminal domain-containing protein [Thermodesulfobacteriota bacterium]